MANTDPAQQHRDLSISPGNFTVTSADNPGFVAEAISKTTPPSPVAAWDADADELDDPKAKDNVAVLGQDHSTGRSHGAAAGGVIKVTKAFLTEGHTAWDSFLSNASSSVGQVILTYPYQMALMGVLPAVAVALGVGILNYYTLWLLIVLYLERKRIMVPPEIQSIPVPDVLDTINPL